MSTITKYQDYLHLLIDWEFKLKSEIEYYKEHNPEYTKACIDQYKQEYELDNPKPIDPHTEDRIQALATKKKDDVEEQVLHLFRVIGIDLPENWEDIVQYVFEDVLDTADAENWTSEDVKIGFRRYLESKSESKQ